MRTSRYRWFAIVVLLAGWALAWVFLWQSYLFDLLQAESGPGLSVFGDTSGGRRLWAAAGTGFSLGVVGVPFLAMSGSFRRYSSGWSRAWLVTGALLIVGGLSFPILFPSVREVIVDERAAVVAMQERWLYARETELLPFGEIARVWLRDQRTSVGRRDACLVNIELSLIRNDRTWLDIPNSFPLAEISIHVADSTGTTLDARRTREC